MGNYNKAPLLFVINPDDTEKYGINIKQLYDLLSTMYQTLDGRQGNLIKLMTTLLTTKGDGSFSVSVKWICDKCGFSKTRYIEARKQLIEMGWIELKANKQIIIHTENII